MKLNIGCSLGIAIFPDNGETLSELTSSADDAMYQAKAEKSNNFYFVNQTCQMDIDILD